MRRLAIAFLLVAALAAAPASAGPKDVWVRHQATGFSIELPRSWYDASSQRKKLLAMVQRLSGGNPDLAPFIQASLAGGRTNPVVKFIAFDLSKSSLSTGFATNLNVVRQRTRQTLDAWGKAVLEGLAAMSFVQQPIWSQKVRLPAGPALRVAYQARFRVGQRLLEVSIVQYGLVQRGIASVLTYTTLPARIAVYKALFARSARSLRFG